MRPLDNLAPAAERISVTRRYFFSHGYPIGRFIALTGVMKIVRFIASLLPFKALMLIITPERTFHLFGLALNSHVLAGAILGAAVFFFGGSVYLKRLHDRSLTDLFGPSPAKAVSLEQLPENYDPTMRRLLHVTTDFDSAIVIGSLLIIASAAIFPMALILLIPAVLIHVLTIATMIVPVKGRHFDLGAFNSNFGFTTMVALLLLLGVLVLSGSKVGLLTALFVFIASRQISANLSEVARALFSFNGPALEAAVRTRIEAESADDVRGGSEDGLSDESDDSRDDENGVYAKSDFENEVANSAQIGDEEEPGEFAMPSPFKRKLILEAAGYLDHRKQNSWFQAVASEVLGLAPSVSDIRWRQMPGRMVESFSFANGAQGEQRRFVLNIYGRKFSGPCNQEREFLKLHGDHPLAVPLAATWDCSRFHMNVLEIGDVVDGDRTLYLEQMWELIATLWRGPPVESLIDRERAFSFLSHLTPQAFSALRAADTDNAVGEQFALLEARVPNLASQVRSLPLVYANPNLSHLTIMRATDGGLRTSLWQGVSVTPMGTQLWTAPYQAMKYLDLLTNDVRSKREDCSDINSNDINLGRCAFGLANCLASKNYSGAIEVVQELAPMLETGERLPEVAE